MPPFSHTALATALHDENPTPLLALVQQRLASLLGARFTVVLAASGDAASHYHLAIQHNRSGLSLEDSGELGPGFATHLLALGTRAKAMLESPTFERMANGNPDQLLVWLSDMANASAAQAALSR